MGWTHVTWVFQTSRVSPFNVLIDSFPPSMTKPCLVLVLGPEATLAKPVPHKLAKQQSLLNDQICQSRYSTSWTRCSSWRGPAARERGWIQADLDQRVCLRSLNRPPPSMRPSAVGSTLIVPTV